MSKDFDAAMKRASSAASAAAAPAPAKETVKDEPLEERSASRLIAESYLYDYKPIARAILREIAFMRMDEDSNYPADSPYKDDKVDWCWLSQKSIGERVGASEVTVQRWIRQFKSKELGGVDGTIYYRDWYDDNHTHHCEYKVNKTAFAMHQRKKNEDRPPRYANPSPSRGRFTSDNQPKKKRTALQEMDDE